MLGVSRCKMRHLQTILAGSTVCFGHNHRQPRTEIFNSRRRSNEGIKRGAIWNFMTGKSPWGNPQIPILLLNGQGEKTPFVESLPPCFSTEPLFPASTHQSLRTQVRAGTDAGTCGGGCKYVRMRWAKLALKSSTPILDKRKGMNDST